MNASKAIDASTEVLIVYDSVINKPRNAIIRKTLF